jgi:hypothetical protein
VIWPHVTRRRPVGGPSDPRDRFTRDKRIQTKETLIVKESERLTAPREFRVRSNRKNAKK